MKIEIPINLSVKDFTITVVIKQQAIDEETAKKLLAEGVELNQAATNLDTAIASQSSGAAIQNQRQKETK